MRARFTVGVNVDEEASAEHVAETGGNKYPLVAAPDEWTWDDLTGAIDREIATEVEIVDYEETPDIPE